MLEIIIPAAVTLIVAVIGIWFKKGDGETSTKEMVDSINRILHDKRETKDKHSKLDASERNELLDDYYRE